MSGFFEDNWKLDDEMTYELPGPLLGWNTVKDIVVFAHSNIYKLEAAGLFPMHLKLGGGRAVWLQSDIIAWMQARIDGRPSPCKSCIRVVPGDRFIGWHELKEMVPYTQEHLHRLEKAGKFPRRVQIGPRRVAWLEREIAQWLWSRRTPTAAASIMPAQANHD